jgi:hypothetical protein
MDQEDQPAIVQIMPGNESNGSCMRCVTSHRGRRTAATHVELFENVMDVVLNGRQLQLESSRNFLV